MIGRIKDSSERPRLLRTLDLHSVWDFDLDDPVISRNQAICSGLPSMPDWNGEEEQQTVSETPPAKNRALKK
jgi:hypothetical protein